MFDQFNTQSLALGKSYTDTFVKAQGLALAGFERITELNLKTFEDRVKASVNFWSEAAEVRDFDELKAISAKGVQLYANGQEVLGVSLKTTEAIGSLAKGSFETTSATITKQVNAAKKAAR
jgi:hypothetical protein